MYKRSEYQIIKNILEERRNNKARTGFSEENLRIRSSSLSRELSKQQA